MTLIFVVLTHRKNCWNNEEIFLNETANSHSFVNVGGIICIYLNSLVINIGVKILNLINTHSSFCISCFWLLVFGSYIKFQATITWACAKRWLFFLDFVERKTSDPFPWHPSHPYPGQLCRCRHPLTFSTNLSTLRYRYDPR